MGCKGLGCIKIIFFLLNRLVKWWENDALYYILQLGLAVLQIGPKIVTGTIPTLGVKWIDVVSTI